MDWTGDPRGTGFLAVIGLLLLVLVAVLWARAVRAKHGEPEFHASEPDELPEYHFDLEDVHDENEPPSSL